MTVHLVNLPDPVPVRLERALRLLLIHSVPPQSVASLFGLSVASLNAWAKSYDPDHELRQMIPSDHNRRMLIRSLMLLGIPFTVVARLLGEPYQSFRAQCLANGMMQQVTQAIAGRNDRIVRDYCRNVPRRILTSRFLLPRTVLQRILSRDPRYRAFQAKKREEQRTRYEEHRRLRRNARQRKRRRQVVREAKRSPRRPPGCSPPAASAPLRDRIAYWYHPCHLAVLIADYLDIDRAAVYAALSSPRTRVNAGSRVPMILKMKRHPPWETLLAGFLGESSESLIPFLGKNRSKPSRTSRASSH